ncbi:CoA transferase [Pigmentiphaga sp. GD03639]|uniref:CoA transferase n=1 Tax=Pigmentiphaga daeguensis TaxID=414049 RepID=A0ABN1BER9_9BURK|nr:MULTISPECIES: CoA transferase [unclassified Pigmentiphaga]MDH2238285.1 CoA transferase [Pigmentiphaga sp. GD03639]OVZ66179.1 carnitine dehydratase [Pigmentiphaga sp. NML030171]
MTASVSQQAGRAPLEGLRIVDLTQVVVGPYATQFLADFGAEVIKIEHPSGDLARWIGGRSPTPGMAAKYLHLNRNKKSLALDLKKPGALDALKKLIASADVVVHNMRPSAAARLGLSAEDLIRLKPDLIYCSVVGFGQEGRYRDKPAYDSIIQGASGLAAINNGGDGQPRFVPMVIADRTVGVMVANSILMAVVQRLRHGGPQVVEVPMFESMTAFVLAEHMFLKTFDPPLGATGDSRLLDPNSRPVRTADGYICVTANTDAQVFAMFEAMGRPELRTDPRFAEKRARFENIGEMFRIRNEVFATRTTAEWLEILEAADIPAMPLHTLDSVLDDPHLADTGLFQKVEHPTEGTITNLRNPVRFSTYEPALKWPAPHIGEHSIELLRDAGLGEEDIQAMVASGATVDHAATREEAR